MTLRTRLTLLVVSLLALAFLVTGTVLTLSVQAQAQTQAQRQAVQALASVIQAGENLDTADERLGVWYGQLSEVAQEFGTFGMLIQTGGEAFRTDNLPASVPVQAVQEARRRGQASTPEAKLLTTAGGTVLLLNVPQQEVASLTRRVALTFAGVAGITLLLAGLGAGWLIRLGLRPVGQMARQAEGIGDNAEQRLPVPQPRDEVRSLAESLNGMLARLQDAFARLNAEEARTRAFAADASHELRTPLAAIQGSLEVLERAGDDPDIRARLTGNLRRESKRASRLVDDLLTLTRLDAGEALKCEELQLDTLLRDLTETARDLAPHLHFVLEAVPVRVQADRLRIEGAVWNLLRNAINATPEEATITLKLALDGSNAVVSVLNPAQLPPEFLPRLFDRFARGPDAAAGGVGLGLAIVQATARAHGGEAFAVQHEQELEVGFRLPV